MNRTEIQKTLENLHAELNSETEVDDQTRALLKTLAEDIQRLSEQEAGQSTEEVESLSEQVQDLLLKFETDYPQLTTVLNQVSAALANLGI